MKTNDEREIFMKVITIVSQRSGCGQITLAVNLAGGLTRQGYRVMIADTGCNGKLNHWLGVLGEQDDIEKGHTSQENHKLPIFQTRMGIDLLRYNGWQPPLISLLESSVYDYVIFIPASEQECLLMTDCAAYVIVCTDLGHANEVEEIQKIEQKLLAGKSCRNLIVPNKINTKEWEKNSRQLFALAEYCGYENIADPIPYCERIHDLPLSNQTVWSLKQENIKDAFDRLLEIVIKISQG